MSESGKTTPEPIIPSECSNSPDLTMQTENRDTPNSMMKSPSGKPGKKIKMSQPSQKPYQMISP